METIPAWEREMYYNWLFLRGKKEEHSRKQAESKQERDRAMQQYMKEPTMRPGRSR